MKHSRILFSVLALAFGYFISSALAQTCSSGSHWVNPGGGVPGFCVKDISPAPTIPTASAPSGEGCPAGSFFRKDLNACLDNECRNVAGYIPQDCYAKWFGEKEKKVTPSKPTDQKLQVEELPGGVIKYTPRPIEKLPQPSLPERPSAPAPTAPASEGARQEFRVTPKPAPPPAFKPADVQNFNNFMGSRVRRIINQKIEAAKKRQPLPAAAPAAPAKGALEKVKTEAVIEGGEVRGWTNIRELYEKQLEKFKKRWGIGEEKPASVKEESLGKEIKGLIQEKSEVPKAPAAKKAEEQKAQEEAKFAPTLREAEPLPAEPEPTVSFPKAPIKEEKLPSPWERIFRPAVEFFWPFAKKEPTEESELKSYQSVDKH